VAPRIIDFLPWVGALVVALQLPLVSFLALYPLVDLVLVRDASRVMVLEQLLVRSVRGRVHGSLARQRSEVIRTPLVRIFRESRDTRLERRLVRDPASAVAPRELLCLRVRPGRFVSFRYVCVCMCVCVCAQGRGVCVFGKR